MALRDYYRCKRCDSKIAYGPERPEEDWEPFLLCRSCIAQGEKLLRVASHALRSYQSGNSSPDLAQLVADSCDAALGIKAFVRASEVPR
jgi:hypothetical protein